MIIVTGGAGFIGSNLVAALNKQGDNDIIIVDSLKRADKIKNLVNLKIADYIDKDDFIEHLTSNRLAGNIDALFHLGACSDTMEQDGQYMMRNNYDYSKSLLHYCQRRKIPFLYASSASVYGGGQQFEEQFEYESPLNVYGYSKYLFDQYVRRLLPKSESQIVGFRYFNVYGTHEQHKGRMASVAYHFCNQFKETGKVNLFEGNNGYENGQQLRDFVYVDDTVEVKLFFYRHPDKSGIYNVGTGKCQSFNDVASAVINSCNNEQLTTEAMIAQGLINYIPFPEALVGKYQNYTQANISRLREAGYEKDFNTVEQGVKKYVAILNPLQ